MTLPWVGHMTWRDLLFAHWPVPASALRPHVPARLEIEEFEGAAWLGIVPFLMTGIRLRLLPPIPGLSRTLELNVRTYVRCGPRSGVYFFSLDAQSWPAVIGARASYHLNYRHARMSLHRDAGASIYYTSRRTGSPPAELRVTYRSTSPPFHAAPGTLDDFLTSRYSLFADDRRGQLYRADIAHPEWPLQHAQAEWELNNMTSQIGVTLPSTPPLLHYAAKIGVRVWPRVRL